MQPYEYAMQYLNVPFLHMGRARSGIDCVGLLVKVAEHLGMDPIDSPYYGREPARNNNSFQLDYYLEANLGPPVKRELRVNDVVLMKLRKRFPPSHVGIIAPHPEGLGLIHTYGEIERVAFHILDDHRKELIVGAYEWPEKS